MKWRRLPPVYSPVSMTSVLRGAGAAIGLGRAAGEDVGPRLARAFDALDAILTDSGTSALVLALRSVVSANAPVALPAYACIDLIAAAVRASVRVMLYDLDPDTLSPDPDSVRAVLSRGAQALVVVPLYGYAPDMSQLLALATEHGVPVIEDAAQSAGGTIDGRRLGSFGDVTVLSFGRGKGTTAGAGGALLLRRPRDLAKADAMHKPLAQPAGGVRELVVLGAQWLLARPELYEIPASIPALRLGEMVYHPANEPSAMSRAARSVLRDALTMDNAEIATRRAHAHALSTASLRGRFVPIREALGSSPGYLRLALLDPESTFAEDPSLGVLRGYPITLDEHQEARPLLLERPVTIHGARALRDRLFTVPTHSRVGPRDLDRLCQWLGAGAKRGVAALQVSRRA